MIAHGGSHTIWAAIVCCAALALAGCGADGTSSLYRPPGNPGPWVSGTVYAPNGQLAAAQRWWQWADAFRLAPLAYAALQSELPITTEENVSLSKLDAAEAAHGSTERALLLANGRTDSDGTYLISNDELAGFQAGLIIVQVGSNQTGTLTRAFVFSCATNATVSCVADIDAASEGVVRLVLDYLGRTTALLTDFSNEDLRKIDYAARTLAANISGASVAEINDNVYTRLAASPTLQNCLKQPDHCS
jgi:hypothetical protein